MLKFILAAFLIAGCVSITKLPPQQSAKAKEYMLQADTHYQTAITQYNEVDQLLNELIKDVEEVIVHNLRQMSYIVKYLKQNPKATEKQIRSLSANYFTQFTKTLTTVSEIIQKQKIMKLKEGESEIAYRKAIESHDEAAKIADVRYVTYGSSAFRNKDILKAEEQALKKNKANDNAWQLESQALKYWDLIYDHYKPKTKNQKVFESVPILLHEFLSAKTEALINYKKAIAHLKEEIKYRRKEFERIKKRL